MFGIGFGELLIIIALALILLGPDKLPEVTRKALKGAAALRRQIDEATRETRAELNDLRHELDMSTLPPIPPTPSSEAKPDGEASAPEAPPEAAPAADTKPTPPPEAASDTPPTNAPKG